MFELPGQIFCPNVNKGEYNGCFRGAGLFLAYHEQIDFLGIYLDIYGSKFQNSKFKVDEFNICCTTMYFFHKLV